MKSRPYFVAFVLSICFSNFLLAQSQQHLEKIQMLDSLASLAFDKANFEASLDYARQNYLYVQKHLQKSDSIYIKIQDTYGYVLMQMGRYEEADVQFSEALKNAAQAYKPTDMVYMSVLGNLSSNYFYAGKFDQAERLYKRQIALHEQTSPKNELLYAQALNNLAVLCVEQQRYEEAEPLYLQAMKIRKDKLGPTHIVYAQSLNNLAILYKNMGRYKDAEAMYLENLAIQKKNSEIGYSRALNNFALYYVAIQQYEKGLPLLEEAQSIRKKILGADHPDYAQTLKNLGRMYEQLGNPKKAEANYLEVVDICDRIGFVNHPTRIDAFVNLAFLYYAQNRKAESMAMIYKSLMANGGLEQLSEKIDANWVNSIENANFNHHQGLISCLSLLHKHVRARWEAEKNNPQLLEEAYLVSKTVLALEHKFRYEFGNDGDKLRMAAESAPWMQRSIRWALEKAKTDKTAYVEAFGFAEQNKSILLSDAMKAQRALSFGDLPDSLAAKEQALQKELSGLKKQLIETKEEAKKGEKLAQLNSLNQKIETFKKELEANYPKYFKLKYAPDDFNSKNIQQLLPEATALIEYFVSDSLVYVFKLTKNNLVVQELAISKTVLSEKVKLLRKSLSDYDLIRNNTEEAYRSYTESAHWFYTALLAPLLEKENGIKRLIIIPDAELGHLPFEAFLTEAAPKQGYSYQKLAYLLRKYQVSYDYSASLWKENQARSNAQQKSGKMLGIAASYGSANINKNTLRAPQLSDLRDALQDLPAAKLEVEALSKLFKGEFLFAAAASESAFKAKAGEYGIIHLAMHGLLNQQYPILSSLAFTENGDSIEDNFLQAYEISHLQLHAQLVVLSACETGYGKFQQGEGVMSLARSFMYAGVPSLVVSLWQVNDASTSAIMQDFYKNLAKGMNKAEALQQAKLEYMRVVAEKEADGEVPQSAAHPAFWAPFIQLGDSRPIVVATKHSLSFLSASTWLGLIGGASLLALGLRAFRQSRKSRA